MTTAAAAQTPSKGLNIGLWILQGLLGLMFVGAGATKGFSPMADLATKIPWTPVVGEAMTRFIGISELLGGLGLILPAATRILPKLTPLAGAALALVMVLACGFHISRAEYGAVPINLVLGGLAAFVAWGRFAKAPISPR